MCLFLIDLFATWNSPISLYWLPYGSFRVFLCIGNNSQKAGQGNCVKYWTIVIIQEGK